MSRDLRCGVKQLFQTIVCSVPEKVKSPGCPPEGLAAARGAMRGGGLPGLIVPRTRPEGPITAR